MKNHIYLLWQRKWDENMLNKVEPLLRNCQLPGNMSSQEAIVLSHVCKGHTHIPHSCQMNVEDIPRCVARDCDLTVNYLHVETVEVSQIHYDAENLRQLFLKITIIDVFDFLYCLFMITCE